MDFSQVFRALVHHIERYYSLKVNVGPVTGSYTGQFDGKEIWVDLDKDAAEAVFILGDTYSFPFLTRKKVAEFGCVRLKLI